VKNCCAVRNAATTSALFHFGDLTRGKIGLFDWELIMLWIIIRIAGLIAALMNSANAEEGIASQYGRESGTEVACGGSLNENALTAAHRSLPCGSRARVTNRSNGKSVVVTINDRGPFVRGRVIDLTPVAARTIGMSGLIVSIASE
jgi:rare lipoprotein A